MKHVLFISLFVCMSAMQLIATNGYCSRSLDVLESERSVILDLSGLAAEVEHFTITDYAGEDVFSDKVAKYENGVKYDLSNLPAGRYTIKVEGENFVETHTTLITREQVIFEHVESHFRPTVKEVDDKIMVEAMFSTVENIQVNIYDAEGELVFEFSDQKSGKFLKTFNLAQLEKGNYTVFVSTDHFSRPSTISL